jgi:HAMP domain-containing protein
MKSDRRIETPAGWITLPILLACGVSALVGWASNSLPIAAAAALPGGLAAAWWAERRLRLVIEPIAQIASGDRSAALPEHAGGGPIGEIARAAERMRQSLIDADALAVAHRRNPSCISPATPSSPSSSARRSTK